MIVVFAVVAAVVIVNSSTISPTPLLKFLLGIWVERFCGSEQMVQGSTDADNIVTGAEPPDAQTQRVAL